MGLDHYKGPMHGCMIVNGTTNTMIGMEGEEQGVYDPELSEYI